MTQGEMELSDKKNFILRGRYNMNEQKNEIVVYQPNELIHLDVRVENETVWLTQSQMGELFGCTTRNVRMHLDNIYSCGELLPDSTRKDFFLVRQEDLRQVRQLVICIFKCNWFAFSLLNITLLL